MAEKCTWITFAAHPTKFASEEDRHPDFFGVFVCPESRRDPDQLLVEILTNRHLVLVETGQTQFKSAAADWGIHERLKAQLTDHGYGLTVTKMQRQKSPWIELQASTQKS